ncbi:MAG TPA: NAD(P)H-binding protein [Bacteroidia bacterium]|jgi:putative NADH-flavin reductase|nr:NAD(P)H-binding protein [Bacteroidia bacterium]
METKKIALFGATTNVGERILNEALSRGHQVTIFVSDPHKITTRHPNLTVVAGDVFSKTDIASKLEGQDAVISAYETRTNPQDHVYATRALIEGVKEADVKQLIAFGHPGSKKLEPGMKMPGNQEGWKAVAQAQRNAIEALRKERGFNWGYAHYQEIEGQLSKTGSPALGNKLTLLTNDNKESFDAENYAKRLLDETEHQMEEHTER